MYKDRITKEKVVCTDEEYFYSGHKKLNKIEQLKYDYIKSFK